MVEKEISAQRQERQKKVEEERARNQKKKEDPGGKWGNCHRGKTTSDERMHGLERRGEIRGIGKREEKKDGRNERKEKQTRTGAHRETQGKDKNDISV